MCMYSQQFKFPNFQISEHAPLRCRWFNPVQSSPVLSCPVLSSPVQFPNLKAPLSLFTLSNAPLTLFTLSNAPQTLFALSNAPLTLFTLSNAPMTLFAKSQAPSTMFTFFYWYFHWCNLHCIYIISKNLSPNPSMKLHQIYRIFEVLERMVWVIVL